MRFLGKTLSVMKVFLSGTNYAYSIDGKKILSGVSGVVHSGEVIAIMGGSGAGKSSLLNILSGRVAKGCIEGTVMLNGKRRPKNLVELVGYVEQEDLLVSHSTVREAVTFSARLRLPKTTSEKEIHDRVEDTIKSLGLEGCANNRIGGTITRGIFWWSNGSVFLSLSRLLLTQT